jgi:hypothetical protein
MKRYMETEELINDSRCYRTVQLYCDKAQNYQDAATRAAFQASKNLVKLHIYQITWRTDYSVAAR